jgi:hypothetical protein
MSDDTLKVGTLELTKSGNQFVYDDHELKISLYPGWKEDKATVRVQYPSGCNSVGLAGDLPSVIGDTLSYMRQEIEQEVRRANKKLKDFNTQCARVLAAIGSSENTG